MLHRAFILGLGSALAVGLAAVACTPAPATPPSPTSAPAPAATAAIGTTPPPAAATAPAAAATAAATAPAKAAAAPAGRVTMVYDPMPHRVLNPALPTAPANGLFFMFPMYDGLTWISRDGTLNPGLARQWRLVDERTWEFTLGSYRFHNGDPVTAQDVADTYNWIRNPANSLPGITFFANVADVAAPSPSVVRVTTTVPDPTLPKALSMPGILPMKVLNEQGAERFFTNPIGSGPFRPTRIDFPNVLEYTAITDGATTPRGLPNVKDLIIRFASEAAVKSSALRANEADIVAPLPSDLARGLAGDGYRLSTFPANGALHFLLDPVSGPTTDVRVRRAINHAVDKETMVRTLLGGFADVDTQLIGPEVVGFNRSLQPYAYDPAQARALLAEAGHANGFRTEITVTTSPIAGREIGESLSAYLAGVGITADVRVREIAEVFPAVLGPQNLRPGVFYGVFNFDQFEPTPWRFFSSETPVERGRRWNEPQTTEFDRYYLPAKREFDEARRSQLYQQAAQYLYDQAPVLFMWRYYSPVVTNTRVEWTPSQMPDAFVNLLRVTP